MASRKRQSVVGYAGVYFVEASRAGGKGLEKVYYIRYRKNGKLIEEKVKNPVQKSICDCLAAVTCAIYFIISFMTMAWHITWLIWIIYALVEEIVKLIFVLKENQNEE